MNILSDFPIYKRRAPLSEGFSIRTTIIVSKTQPPTKDISLRSYKKAADAKNKFINLLKTLEPGQRLEVYGNSASLTLINSYITSYDATYQEYNKKFKVCMIDRQTFGVWRIR